MLRRRKRREATSFGFDEGEMLLEESTKRKGMEEGGQLDRRHRSFPPSSSFPPPLLLPHLLYTFNHVQRQRLLFPRIQGRSHHRKRVSRSRRSWSTRSARAHLLSSPFLLFSSASLSSCLLSTPPSDYILSPHPSIFLFYQLQPEQPLTLLAMLPLTQTHLPPPLPPPSPKTTPL